MNIKHGKNNVLASKSRVFAVLTIDGKRVRMPVSSFKMQFSAGIDNLPVARLSIPIGSVVGNSKEQSPIHKVSDQINETTIVDVYFSAEGDRTHTKKWPKGVHLIWHGTVAGTSESRTATSFTYDIDSIHWIRSLTEGSFIGKEFFKSSYADLLVTSNVSTGTGRGFANLAALAHLLSDGIQNGDKSFWLNGVMPVIAALAAPSSITDTQEFINDKLFTETIEKLKKECSVNTKIADEFIGSLGIAGPGGNRTPGNLAALYTLTGLPMTGNPKANVKQIVDGKAVTNGFFFSTLPNEAAALAPSTYEFFFSNKFELNPATVSIHVNSELFTPEILLNIGNDVTRILGTNLGSASIADKVSAVSSAFLLSVLPSVRTAVVAAPMPVFAASQVWRTLKPSEYTDISAPIGFPQTIAAVGFIGQATTGGAGKNNPVNPAEIAAFFIGAPKGQAQLMQSPPWLRAILQSSSAQSVTASPYNRGARSLDSTTQTLVQKIGCNLAHAYWAWAHFGQRSMTIKTPLRFDIAPGSYLAVQGFSGNLGKANSPDHAYYGYVRSVGISIDGVSGAGSTLFELSHIRTKKDEDDGMIPQEHPLYSGEGEAWSGMPLVRMEQADLFKE